jgi:serine-type D-Ala-D-Ala carboxypeptidase/endopeptidase (penicillin-binding protein 4)
MKAVLILILMGVLLSAPTVVCHSTVGAGKAEHIDFPDENNACFLADPDGHELVSENGDQPLIPASTLKILTSLAAYHYLGADHRFKTELYLDSERNLKIKGYGDPLLTSEVLSALAEAALAAPSLQPPQVQNLILDGSFFSEPLVIPGVSNTLEPYDAPNGALCANFNTVSFIRSKSGTYASAEPQTPLVPSALQRIRASGLKEGRIALSNQHHEPLFYLGELFALNLAQRGVLLHGNIQLGTVNTDTDKRLISFSSPYCLDETISKLLAYSSNFIANQLLLSIGAKAFGPPATLEKGVRATRNYAEKSLGIKELHIAEGSGIGRENRVSARMMATLLHAFLPHRDRMRQTQREYYKTGTLDGISTRAGYIKGADGGLYPFVVMLNTNGQSMEGVMDKLHRIVAGKANRASGLLNSFIAGNMSKCTMIVN